MFNLDLPTFLTLICLEEILTMVATDECLSQMRSSWQRIMMELVRMPSPPLPKPGMGAPAAGLDQGIPGKGE